MECCRIDQELLVRHDHTKVSAKTSSSRPANDSHSSVTTNKTLVGMLTIHVDDVKIAGEPWFVQETLELLQKEFGQLKILWHDFVNCGVQHSQDKNTKEITLDQNAYAQTLKKIVHPELPSGKAEDAAPTELHKLYMSLLGAVAYLCLTRIDIHVFVSALQRHSHAPKFEHCRKLNKLLVWIQRHPKKLAYKRMPMQDTHIRIISDAAFKKEPEDGYSLRGALFLRCSGSFTNPGPCHVLDWCCKSQRHVCRSTFASELLSACDALDQGLLVAQIVHEVTRSTLTATQARTLRDFGGFMPMAMCIDAKSVHAATTATFIKTPAEKSLLTHIQFIRELLDHGVLSALFWIDTRDMYADGLTKGAVDRTQLHALMEGHIEYKHEYLEWKPKKILGPGDTTESRPADTSDNSRPADEAMLTLLVDIAEAFAGKALMTRLSPEFGLTASSPADTLYGWDLSTPEGARRWKQIIVRDRPVCVIIGFACTNWSSLTNTNYWWRPRELQALRAVDRHMLSLMVWTMHEQSKHNRYFLFENPPSSQLWGEPIMQSVYSLPNVQVGVGDACMYGKVIPDSFGFGHGLYLRKRHRWLANHVALLQATCAQCNNSHEHHQSTHGEYVHGSLTKWSGEYTPQLARSILRAVEHILAQPR